MNRGSQPCEPSRRAFIKAGVATAAVAGLPLSGWAEENGTKKSEPLPMRVLGRTGEKVTMLNLGTGSAPSPRMLSAAYEAGIRYIDTADCYDRGASEKVVAEWLEKTGLRKEFFIVDKDHPATPDEWVKMVDARLEALKTDYIDLYFLHGLGGGSGNVEEGVRDVPKLKEWGEAADKMKKAGKIKFAGFSTHTEMSLRIDLLNNAAKGGWVDAIMVAYDPKLVRDNAEFNKALDACHEANIGLISMKGMRGLNDVPKILPQFEEMGLTPHQAVLHCVWTDERMSSICSHITNLAILKENSDAARNYKPMDEKQVSAVIGLYEQYVATFCNGCDGRCQRAGGTKAALADMARYLSYFEYDGSRREARRLFAALSQEEREWRGANLAAASAACVNKLDFAAILSRAEEKLA
jgi:predicted aldo/keto reductase-like oxidoreductase